MMLGGVICGYCAMGNVNTETTPASVMANDSTVAKIGRLMKKRVNTTGLLHRNQAATASVRA